MARNRFALPAGVPSTRYRLDTASATATPATLYALAEGGPTIDRALVLANSNGTLPTVYADDAITTLYVKQLRYDDAVVATTPVGAGVVNTRDVEVRDTGLAARALTRALAADRPGTTVPTITTGSAAPTINGVAAIVHNAATGAAGTPLLGALNTAEFSFVGGRYMKAAGGFPLYNGVRKLPRPVSPQGFGDPVAEFLTDAPAFAFQQVLSQAGSMRVLVDGVELYRCGPTLRTGTAQAGAASSITLDTGASATNGVYVTRWVRITSGTGAGQSKLITGYVGSTKVATVAGTWATAPDATSVFELATGRRDNNTSSGNGYVLFDFAGDRRMRSVRVECFGTTFMGVLTGAADVVIPAPASGAESLIWVGDSFGAGVGSDAGLSMAAHAAAGLGMDLVNLSIGGTGWLNPGTQGLNAADRILPPYDSWWIGGGYGSTAGTFVLTRAGVSTSAIAYNAGIATIQSALDAAFGAGTYLAAGDSGTNFYVLRRTGDVDNTTPMTATFSVTGGLMFIRRWDGELAGVLPVDAAGRPDRATLVWVLGHNDTTSTNAAYTPAALQAQAQSLMSRVGARWPQLRQIMIGNLFLPGGSVGGDVTTANAALQAAAAAVLPKINGQVPFVDTLGTAAGTVPWSTGAGYLGAQTGTGTSDVQTDTDHVHPTPPGALALGTRVVIALQRIFRAFVPAG